MEAGDSDEKENIAQNTMVLEKRKSQDDSDESPNDQSPKRPKYSLIIDSLRVSAKIYCYFSALFRHDILTPTYVYSIKKRKPLLDDM